MKYRSEIDGLRAVAVVPVILFHADFEIASGGFIGVDIFFVISGYLITNIILHEKDESKFSLLNFYERRARRLLPALILVIIFCLPFAWFLLLPSDMMKFSQSLIAVATFSSNIFFWRESGYFETASELNPFLHTWSLAVEEQFYIFFPLFLLGTLRYGRRVTLWMLVVLFAISFAIAQWGAYNMPAATFYLLPTRAWELLIGSFAAFVLQSQCFSASPWIKNALSTAGLISILCSVIAFDETTPFPSFYAIAPTLGTFFIIIFATPGTVINRILSFKILIGIGIISYSMYLWHQPVFAFWRYYSAFEETRNQMVLLSVLCVPLAYLTYRFVESPFRIKGGSPTHKKLLLPAGAMLFSIIVIGAFGYSSTGIPLRFSDGQLTFVESTSAHTLRHSCNGAVGTPCTVFGPEENFQRHIFVIGDSHSDALLPAFRILGEQGGVRISHSGLGGCPPLLGVFVEDGNHERGACEALTRQQIRFALDENVSTVVLAARWSLYVNGSSYGSPKSRYWLVTSESDELTLQNSRNVFEFSLSETVNYWLEIGVNVFIVEQIPQQELFPNPVISRFLRASDDHETSLSGVRLESHEHLQAYSNSQIRRIIRPGVQAINFEGNMCADGICYLLNHQGSLYSDRDHLSNHGATSLAGTMTFYLQ